MHAYGLVAGEISAPGARTQKPGGAGPRAAMTNWDRESGRRPKAQAMKKSLTRFAVVIMPPLSTAATIREDDAHIQTS